MLIHLSLSRLLVCIERIPLACIGSHGFVQHGSFAMDNGQRLKPRLILSSAIIGLMSGPNALCSNFTQSATPVVRTQPRIELSVADLFHPQHIATPRFVNVLPESQVLVTNALSRIIHGGWDVAHTMISQVSTFTSLKTI